MSGSTPTSSSDPLDLPRRRTWSILAVSRHARVRTACSARGLRRGPMAGHQAAPPTTQPATTMYWTTACSGPTYAPTRRCALRRGTREPRLGLLRLGATRPNAKPRAPDMRLASGRSEAVLGGTCQRRRRRQRLFWRRASGRCANAALPPSNYIYTLPGLRAGTTRLTCARPAPSFPSPCPRRPPPSPPSRSPA